MDVKWSLWVFAGPGAYDGGQATTLADMVRDPPHGIELLAETIEAPTVLQRLTGEWPAERLAAGGTPTSAERDLGRFVEWADSRTHRASKRALIVLGDLLHAIGQAPKALVAGPYRPPYPAQIRITKKGGSTTTHNADSVAPFNGQTTYGGQTLLAWLDDLSPGDAVSFDGIYTYTLRDGGEYDDGSSNYCKIVTREDRGTSIDVYITPSARSFPQTFTLNGTVYGPKTTPPNRYTTYSSSSTSIGKTLSTWASGMTSGDVISFDGQTTYTLKDATATPRVYTSGSSGSSEHLIDYGASIFIFSSTPSRSLDDVGPADVDPTTRRIQALVSALDALGRHKLDLLVSDEGDVLQIAALRRLAPRATVLLGARRRSRGSGQLLEGLVETLRSEADILPDELAKRTMERADQEAGLVALRGSAARPLVDALEQLAGRALTPDSPVRRCFEAVWTGGTGGDLADLIGKLASVDAGQATRIEACATKAIIAPAPAAGGSRLGIGLDGRGLQLGPQSNWTRLLDAAHGDSDEVRSTLEDMQALTMSARRARRAAVPKLARASLVLEYPGPAPGEALTPAKDFARFLKTRLQGCDARHIALVVRGTWSSAHPGSVTLDRDTPLSIVELARHLRAALSRRGRGPLAMLVFEDPELLRIENAYELRELAFELLTTCARATSDVSERITEQLVKDCEQQAACLWSGAADPSPWFEQQWRRDVAARLANLLVAPGDGQVPELQGIHLQNIDSLCHMFGHLCRRMFENLGDPAVTAAARAGEGAASMIEWINRVQMEGFWPRLESGRESETVRDLYNAWGRLYNWLSQSASAHSEGGAAFWADPKFVEDRDPAGYCSRLRISIGPERSSDYPRLSFHQDVALHALLTAARLLHEGKWKQEGWGLISMGIAYGPSKRRHEQLASVTGDPGAASYFRVLGTPPLVSLAIDRRSTRYELSLQSSESDATVVRSRSIVGLEVIDASLERLSYIISGSMASREGWRYLEGLGASLSEDVASDLHEQLERERKRVLETGRRREAHLALQLPRELMGYPWELMQLPVRAPGAGFEMLAERFAVGRQMWSDRAPQRVGDSDRTRVLIVADPSTRYDDLPAAREEGREIERLLADMSVELPDVFECDAWIGGRLTRTVLRQCLRNGNYDVVHFAGHGTYDADDPDESGWVLSDGLLTVTELRNTLTSCEAPPWLIYANACSAGMIGKKEPSSYHGDVHGMAEACIRAGARAYVAPLWRIHDESARMLAREFYRCLLFQGTTIGVALQKARLRTRKLWEERSGDMGLGDVSWAGMVLFGNPGMRLGAIES